MLRVGLTGGIASGKSTVGEWFRSQGVPVLSADQIAREVVRTGSPALAELRAEFGKTILLPSGELDRPALAARAFGDESSTHRLNAIVHPRIRKAAEAAFQQLEASGEPLAVYDAPLLFETGLEQQMHKTVVVWAEPEQQLKRARLRSGWTDGEIRNRMSRQWPLKAKRDLADFVIDNSESRALTLAQSRVVLEQLRRLSTEAEAPQG